MKMKYETPVVEKLEFNYSETVTASGNVKTHASKGPAACDGAAAPKPHVDDGKVHASKGPAKCS